MTFQGWLAFALLVTVLSLTPGPAVLLVLSQAISRGIGRTAWTIFGIMACNFLYFALSATGLSAILIASPKLFSAVKLIGAGCLVVLGIIELISRNPTLSPAPGGHGRAAMLAKGLMLQLSSPAALLFFVAVIPQFLNPKMPLIPQLVLLAVTGNLAECFVLFFYAGVADRFIRLVMMGRYPSALKLLSGLMLIAAGLGIMVLDK